MALGGVAPLLIFHFPLLPKSVTASLAGIPYVGNTLASAGVPIPIYLDEQLSGIQISGESTGIDVDEDPQLRNDDKTPPIVKQKGLNSILTVNMICRKDSIFLNVIQAFADIMFSKVVAQNYSVSWLSSNSAVFGGLLHQFQTEVSDSDNLVRVTLQISKANQALPTPKNPISAQAVVTADIPGAPKQ
jgi:hypothetical protein